MFIKNFSKADIEFIKKCLRYYKKNKDVSDKDVNRMNYLLNNLDKNENKKIFADIIDIYKKAIDKMYHDDLHQFFRGDEQLSIDKKVKQAEQELKVIKKILKEKQDILFILKFLSSLKNT